MLLAGCCNGARCISGSHVSLAPCAVCKQKPPTLVKYMHRQHVAWLAMQLGARWSAWKHRLRLCLLPFLLWLGFMEGWRPRQASPQPERESNRSLQRASGVQCCCWKCSKIRLADECDLSVGFRRGLVLSCSGCGVVVRTCRVRRGDRQ